MTKGLKQKDQNHNPFQGVVLVSYLGDYDAGTEHSVEDLRLFEVD